MFQRFLILVLQASTRLAGSPQQRAARLRHWAGLALSGLLLGASLAASAAPATPARGKPDAALEAAFAQQRLALAMIRHGDRERDPLALIVAARMQKQLGTQTTPDSPYSAEALLARAARLAGDRKDLLALIEDARSEGRRGAERGPSLEHFFAPVDALQQMVVRFIGGAPAKVALEDKDGQLVEIEVVDAQGQSVCVRQRGAKDCSWTPSQDGEYRIRIRNVGATPGEITLFHN